MARYSRPLRLAYFSPLPPARSGISEYSRDLLPHLAPWAEVHLYADEPVAVAPEIAWRFPVSGHSNFAWEDRVDEYDCTIFHLGNSPVHRYLYPYLLAHPGVLVLHEHVIHHLLAGMALEPGGAATYLRAMAYEHGPEGALMGWRVLTGRQQAPFFEYPLSAQAVDVSLGTIVHSRYLLQEVLRLSPRARVQVIPMPVPLPQLPVGNREATRRRLGLPDKGFLVGTLGEAAHHKRLDVLLGAFARLSAKHPDAFLTVVGRVAPGLDLPGLVTRLGVAHRVQITGAVPESGFQDYLSCIDVSVSLRYPTAGETSAAALRSMAAGRATVVSDIGASQDLPEWACFKIPVGPDEEALLAAVLERLARDRPLQETLGRNARRFVQVHHAPPQSARAYVEFINELLQRGMEPPAPPPASRPAGRLVREMSRRMHEMGLTTGDSRALERVAEGLTIMEAADGIE